MNKCIIHSGISALFLFSLLVGCIKEDSSNYHNGMTLSISCENYDNEDILSKSIDNISVYIFDSDGKYVKTVKESTEKVETANHEMFIPIEITGLYKIITLGDTDVTDYTIYSEEEAKNKKSLIPSISHIDDFRVQLKCNSDNIIKKKLDGFFIEETLDIEVKGYENTTYNTYLTKNNKLIRFTIEGLSSAEPVIRSKNSLYDKDNNTPDNAQEIIYKPYSKDIEKGIYLTTTLRIFETIEMPLTIEINDSDNLHLRSSYDLVELIQHNPKYKTQQSLDREDTFDITFKYDGDVVISIKVNEWEVINAIPRP